MGVAEIQTAAAVAALLTRELILAAALLIAIIGIDDLIVDAIYFTRRIWRSATIYRRHPRISAAMLAPPRRPRSEEHTSELQSLMRISYAVFCLKKKKHTN